MQIKPNLNPHDRNNAQAKEFTKIFRSHDANSQGQIVIAPAPSLGFYYIYFDGFEQRYDGSVFLYHKLKNDNHCPGHHYKLCGLTSVNVRDNDYHTLINGTITPYLEIYLEHGFKTEVTFDSNASEDDSKLIEQAYLTHQFIVDTKAQAQCAIDEAHRALEQATGTTLELTIDWLAFTNAQLDYTPAKVAAYLTALIRVSQIDSDYFEAVQAITNIEITPSNISDQHRAALVEHETKFLLTIGDNVPNLPETCFDLLYNAF